MSRPVTITLSHELGLEEARDRVRRGFDQIKGQMTGGLMFKFDEEWSSDDTLRFSAAGLGQKITGQIDVFPQHIRIEVVLPNVLAAIAETISGNVEKQGKLLLEKK